MPRYSTMTAAQRFWSHVANDGPLPDHVADLGHCWVWTGAKSERGYGKFNPHGKTVRAHRFSWELHHGPATGLVLHRCDNRLCVRPEHLFLGSNKDNTVDAIFKLRLANGERHGNHKLSDAQVVAIRCDGRAYELIAAEMGVTPTHVRKIRNGSSRRDPTHRPF